MSNTKIPLINGYLYSFASVTANVKGTKIPVLKSIDYTQEKTPGEVRGNHSQVIGRTRGDLKDSGSMELYLAEADTLIRALGDGYMDVPFDIIVTYAEDGQATITDKLFGCVITKIESNNTQSSDGTTRKFDLHIMHTKLSGLDPIKNML